MLFNKDINFKQYPQSVQVAIVSLVLGWALHLYYYFTVVAGSEMARNDYLMIGVGAAICFFVAAINRWARMMCIFFNLGIIFMYLALTLMQQTGFGLRVLSGAVVGLFCVSTYYLLRKETSDFFKRYNRPAEQDEPEETQGS